jgi:histidinol-phosphate phosphatase family protein
MPKQPAVFIDRDGTINVQVEVLTEPSQIELLPGAGEAIADLNRRGFFVFGITNQPIMEKGLLTPEKLNAIHAVLQEKLAKFYAHLDAIYTCPHRFIEGRPCRCRKPELGLIEDAQKEFSIDMEHSWLVGDRLRDIETGRRAKFATILVGTGGNSKDDTFFPDTKPDHSVSDLAAAVKLIK